MKDESCERGWWTEGEASEQLLIGARRGRGRPKHWPKAEERQWPVASLNAT